MKNCLLAILLSCAAMSGCSYENKTTVTSPSASSVAALMGTWASATSGATPSSSTCTDFKWTATELTSSAAKGSFSATCAGELKLAGNAEATLSGSTIMWSATGTATAAALPPCNVTLSGTAEIGLDSIRVPYTGNTCLGPVSGVEILNRK